MCRGSKRSCVYDAVINSFNQLGYVVNKERLYKKRDPREIKNTTVRNIMCLNEVSRFEVLCQSVYFGSMKGSLE